MTWDGVSNYAYNAEGQTKTAAGVNYTYDGDNNRVQKSIGKLYWYSPAGEVLDESDASGNITDEYVYFAGNRVAHRDQSGNIFYYFEDHLGTSRVVTTATGTTCYDADFYPFGGERYTRIHEYMPTDLQIQRKGA
jgi:YD repeat-containing protein